MPRTKRKSLDQKRIERRRQRLEARKIAEQMTWGCTETFQESEEIPSIDSQATDTEWNSTDSEEHLQEPCTSEQAMAGQQTAQQYTVSTKSKYNNLGSRQIKKQVTRQGGRAHRLKVDRKILKEEDKRLLAVAREYEHFMLACWDRPEENSRGTQNLSKARPSKRSLRGTQNVSKSKPPKESLRDRQNLSKSKPPKGSLRSFRKIPKTLGRKEGRQRKVRPFSNTSYRCVTCRCIFANACDYNKHKNTHVVTPSSEHKEPMDFNEKNVVYIANDMIKPSEQNYIFIDSDMIEPTEQNSVYIDSDESEPSEQNAVYIDSDESELSEQNAVYIDTDMNEPSKQKAVFITTDIIEPSEQKPVSFASDMIESIEQKAVSIASDMIEQKAVSIASDMMEQKAVSIASDMIEPIKQEPEYIASNIIVQSEQSDFSIASDTIEPSEQKAVFIANDMIELSEQNAVYTASDMTELSEQKYFVSDMIQL